MGFPNFSVNRRDFLLMSGAAVATTTLIANAQSRAPIALRTRKTDFSFGAHETHGLVSVEDNAPPPVIRLRQGEPAQIDVTNGLEDFTTMHWHGIRLPNAMDGVPYLTQFPIGEEETFNYSFTPPDAGTYWYHPHCRTMNQMACGLTGILIVEEQEAMDFDQDLALNLKDFRLDDDGQLRPFFTKKGAARGGTLGNVMTTNWLQSPRYDVGAGGLLRLRIAVTDTTRVHKLVFPGVAGKIIAWDGHPVNEEIAWPTAKKPLLLSPGQRVDVALRMPDTEGEELVFSSMIGSRPHTIASLRAIGTSKSRQLAELKPLAPNPVAAPDLENSEMHELVFGWSPDGDGQRNGLCGSSEFTFWSINRTPWPGDAVTGVGPVADLKLGKSYVLRLRNESPNMHPIHLHGLTFVPLRSNLRALPKNWTDTILLQKYEVVDIALVADNPGDWAFHCHVIEHQKTGLAGYIRVS